MNERMENMDEVIKNLYTLFDAAWEENNNGRGTDVTRMVTTFVPDAIQDLQAYKDIEDIKEDNMQDAMIRASNKAGLTMWQLINANSDKGYMGIYNLGMKHMYEYLKGEENG